MNEDIEKTNSIKTGESVIRSLKDRKLSLEEVAAAVVDAAFHIHDELGPGLLESVYQKVLCAVLRSKGFCVETEVCVRFSYAGIVFDDDLRIDLFVEKKLIVELKSVEKLVPVHSKQLLSYLRLMKRPLGLLINFGSHTFKEGCCRVVNCHVDTVGSSLKIH